MNCNQVEVGPCSSAAKKEPGDAEQAAGDKRQSGRGNSAEVSE